MLYLIGSGLGTEKDFTLKSIETLNNCSFIYIEEYTSIAGFSIEDLEKILDKKERHIELVDRTFVECADEILGEAKKSNVALVIKGDVFSATTHINLFLRAKKENIKVNVLHNASILTAVGDTGLSLYKFGRVASIPFNNKDVVSPYEILRDNLKLGMHTLFLLDLNPLENKFMSVKEAIDFLLRVESVKNEKVISEETLFVCCAALGTDDSEIIVYKKDDDVKLNAVPQCLIVPSNLHFMEEDMLSLFRKV